MAAGRVLEDEAVTIDEKGTGQASLISPLLASVYLHYVFVEQACHLVGSKWPGSSAAHVPL
jgi:retron-type reverse transcriptase